MVEDHSARTQTPQRFGVCSDYGCAKLTMVTLTTAEWAAVRAAFGPAPANPAAERQAIRRAIGQMERIVGPKTGTDQDQPGAALINFSRAGQMDCIDEAFNSTTYLRFLERDGLLLWHRVGLPVRRGSFIDRWPHNTATISEMEGGGKGAADNGAAERNTDARAYAVDSWFHGNGVPPEVVPVTLWLKGWSPKKVYRAGEMGATDDMDIAGDMDGDAGVQ